MRIAGIAVAAVALVVVVMMASCKSPITRRPEITDYRSRLPGPPLMRVLLYRGSGPIVLSSEGPCSVSGFESPGEARELESLPESELTISNGRFHFDGRPIDSSEIRLKGTYENGHINIEGRKYPGTLKISMLGSNSMMVINYVDIESYLAIVVPGEMPQRWPVESLKAQTVAARTYALMRKKERADELFDVHATVADQVYRGREPISEELIIALRDTRGLVMFHNSRLFHAYYHSTCGGSTVNVDRVMRGQDAFFIKGVQCNYCDHSPYHSWEFTIHSSRMGELLAGEGTRPGRDLTLDLGKDGRGRNWPVKSVTAQWSGGGRSLTVDQFRDLLGRTNIRSQFFDIRKSGDLFLISGTGFGHRAGMCQYGAGGMGQEGTRFDRILYHYYGDVELGRIY